ncbi:hypothetical protein [Vibrio phage XZ1]|uniref:Uncharacterized protein n=1 Tax=Vibrio phage ValKK3 TaxID=1610855 RepID=A0A0D4DBG5_9CAUD|nr:hypothetical protein AVU32_gp072 [Vibrio phage ValKK3]AJT60913.1 hypothetical protein [Vibrio phage ValKK3]UOL51339.1 hypothetical protein [Vibrio phage XZ1]
MKDDLKDLDYTRHLLVISYKSGRAFAFWVYRMDYEESYGRKSINWDEARDAYTSSEIRSQLISQDIALMNEPLQIANDFDDIESIWVAQTIEGKDGFKPKGE